MDDWNITTWLCILFFQISVLIFIIDKVEEILDFMFCIKLNLIILLTSIQWSFYLGTKGYTITYKKQDKEYKIDFPIIWL